MAQPTIPSSAYCRDCGNLVHIRTIPQWNRWAGYCDHCDPPKTKQTPICTECGSPTTHCYPGDCSRAATDPMVVDGWEMAYYGD